MISVIVPIYNIEEYVKACIESIISQSYGDLEIILVDDGSTDHSGEICDAYAGKDNRIKVIHKQNGGLVSARKAGLGIAGGEYISYVDGDDWIDSQTYQRLLDMNRKTGIKADIIAFAGYEEYGKDGLCGFKKNTVREGLYESSRERYGLYSNMMVSQNFYENGVSPYLWAKLIKRELLMETQEKVPDSVSYAEDVACVYPCLLKAQSIYISNCLLYHYRVRPDSMVKAEVEMDRLSPLFRTLGDSFSVHPLNVILKRQLKYFMRHAMLLKGYRQIENSMVLFPFEKVKKGMRVAVYGAGMFGKNIWNYCKSSENITEAGWFDRRYEVYAGQGLCVQSPERILDLPFDIIVVAVISIGTARKIKEELVQRGVHPDRIDYIRMEAIEEMKLPDYMNNILPE